MIEMGSLIARFFFVRGVSCKIFCEGGSCKIFCEGGSCKVLLRGVLIEFLPIMGCKILFYERGFEFQDFE